ncbi:MAG: glycosyltransferase [Gemmatimonadales bacterium]|nr:glycosyltransferase [Gemmatimonadales bacterium]NIN11639.1 glycosyltransferase [Gemmatimonadales bacterium]NIN50245.1 glycosyltransferase [Gemmatimonadales bacterium]NIP07709.1 glycosyltransferase [Gemmatimonadales bacterium]NIR01861.1 glycosyltransferase [Gemmatimonadales bacterium]
MTLARGDNAEVSILVPANDEAESLPEFVRQCADALRDVSYPCEVVVVDDGSEDDTPAVLDQLAAEHDFLRVVTHRSRRGIADALRSAGEVARGDIFVFYPADLQFLPAEIPSLVEPIRAGEVDIVTGTKQGEYEKAFVSGIYNSLCRWLFGIRVTDLNAVKAYRREVMGVIPARPDWHRFMVVIAATDGFRVTGRPVKLLPRRAGQSKFGIGRIPVGVMDLLSVWFQLRFGRKPLLFFGVSGGVLFALGFLVGVLALVLRFGYGIGFRPLLDLVMVLVISGIALFGFGFVGEMLAGAREDLRAVGRSLDQLISQLQRRKP